MNAATRPVIVRRKKIVNGRHGGSWKIALADFMTALMALFLVMWILSTASREQRAAVADYFNTPLLAAMAGGDNSGASASAIPGGGDDPVRAEGELRRAEPQSRDGVTAQQRQFFRQLQRRIEEAIEADPALRELRRQMRFDLTQEGLRIQLLDTEQRPMFDLGSDQVAPYMRSLLQVMAPLLNELTNDLSISGHTDSHGYASGYRSYSNWELAADRANASRRELVAGGLAPEKLLRVAGLADRVPLPDAEGSAAINRRIEVVVLFPEVSRAIRSPLLISGEKNREPPLATLGAGDAAMIERGEPGAADVRRGPQSGG
ncbi:MAG: flagellar motor protein MotB [Pseudomonas sp.]